MFLWSAAVAVAFGLGCCASARTVSARMTAATRLRAGLGRDSIANLIEHVLHLVPRLITDVPRCARFYSFPCPAGRGFQRRAVDTGSRRERPVGPPRQTVTVFKAIEDEPRAPTSIATWTSPDW